MAITETYNYDRTFQTYNNGNAEDLVKLSGSSVTSPTVYGSYIPLSEGYRAVDGAVIWAGTPFQSDMRYLFQFSPDPAIQGTSQRTWNVKRSCAFSLGYRLSPSGAKPTVRRIWVNGQLAYSMGNEVPVTYDNFSKQYMPNGQWVNGVFVPNAANLVSGALVWSEDGSGAPNGSTGLDGAGNFVGQVPITSSINFRFHDGSEDQNPDQEILAALGDDAPSYRGLMYLVIDDLLVGQGSEQNVFFQPNVNVDSPTKTGSQTVQGGFPAIRVELVDDATTTTYDNGMIMLADSPTFEFAVPLIPNWEAAKGAAIVATTNGGFLHIFDLDTKSEISYTFVSGLTGERIGGDAVVWDKVHDFFWSVTGFTSARSMVTVSKTGAVISGGFLPGFDLGYGPSNGFPISETNPTDTFPHIQVVDLGYAVVNGSLESVLFGASSSGHSCAIHLHADGTFSNVLYPHQIVDVPAGYGPSDVIKALPLWVHATQDQHLSSQDCCFVQTYGNSTAAVPGGARFVFVGMQDDGTTVIKGTQTIFTGTTPGSIVTVAMDSDGNLILQEEESGIDPTITTKFMIDYLGEPDFVAAPRWRGLFPVITSSFSVSTPSASAMSLDGASQAEVSGNVFYRGGDFMDLNTLKVTTSSGLSASGLWDNSRNIVYYYGSVTQSSPNPPFSGHAMRWTQVISGLLGSVGTLSNTIKDLAVAARYTVGDLSIDSNLSVVGVPGVLITQPTDLSTLFNSMGAIYEFGYFNSGGKLTFRSSSNTPAYASGYIQNAATFNMLDGDTVTVGTIVYRFKTTPSAPFDVQISVDESALRPNGFVRSLANLYAAIKGDSALGADAVPFFAGTVANPKVTVKPDVQSAGAYGYSKMIVTAAVGGLDGNSVAMSSSSGRMLVNGTTLVGGAEALSASINITLDNLCMVGENQITQTDAIITSIPPPGASQQAASVTYYALDQDYAQATQTFTPDNLGGSLPDSTTTVPYVLPIVMSTSEAYARVSQTAFASGAMVITQEFRLPQAYLAIEPNDVLNITIAPFQYTVRVDEATFNGDFSMSISATNFSARTDIPINNSDSKANVPQTVPGAGDALPLFMDAPVLNALQGTYAGFMDFVTGARPYYSTFKSATLLEGTSGQTPGQIFTTTEPVKWGKLLSSMPAFVYPGYVIEETSITISCNSLSMEDLQTATDDASFIAGENCVAVGRPGSWEYVFFRDVAQVASRVIRLTGLIRAQRGTEVAAASHTTDDYVVLMASANPAFKSGTRPQSLPVSSAGTSLDVLAAGAPATRAASSETEDIKGYSLYPFAPTLLDATLLGGNDLDLTWVRRDRLSTTFVADPTVLSETSEKYDLEILSGSTVVRTLLDLTSPTYTYTSTQQTTDGFTPPLASIKFRVYQKGELGRGFAREETVNVH